MGKLPSPRQEIHGVLLGVLSRLGTKAVFSQNAVAQ